jgi:hypothetical protein
MREWDGSVVARNMQSVAESQRHRNRNIGNRIFIAPMFALSSLVRNLVYLALDLRIKELRLRAKALKGKNLLQNQRLAYYEDNASRRI